MENPTEQDQDRSEHAAKVSALLDEIKGLSAPLGTIMFRALQDIHELKALSYSLGYQLALIRSNLEGKDLYDVIADINEHMYNKLDDQQINFLETMRSIMTNDEGR